MTSKPIHGLSYTSEYRAWQMMRLRCNEPKNAAYPSYGGRGIKVSDRWMVSVEAFVSDMGLKPSPGHELDRKNNDGDYTPENCRWVTRKVNDRNRRSNRRFEYAGETLTLAEWAERFDIRSNTLKERLNLDWTIEESLTIPVRLKAAKGCGQTKHQCIDCGNLCGLRGVRCLSCSNKFRANFQHEAKFMQARVA